jgi:hypothetical protein
MSFRFNRPGRACKTVRPRTVIVAALVALGSALAIIGLAVPASASPSTSTPVVKIYLTFAPRYCADVKDDNNSAGELVWLYKCSQSKSDEWQEYQQECIGQEGQPQCFDFVDVRNDQLCLGLDNHRVAVLQKCGYGGDNAPYSSIWGPTAKNGLRNNKWGTEGNLWTPRASNTSKLYGEDEDAGGPGWWQWSGY